MPRMPVDHGLLARQVALPELGLDGHERLAVTPVRFEGVGALADTLHPRAGGAVAPDAAVVVAVAPVDDAQPALALGAAAWACVEAARRVSAQTPLELPEALRARLTVGS